MDERLWAAQELLKRYMTSSDDISVEMTIEALAVTISTRASAMQKKAARIILVHKFGTHETNRLIENNAVVKSRRDPLVQRWRRKVIERDKCCQKCGEKGELHAHHISHWANDPINRVNESNGIALCPSCHALEHPELNNLIMSRGGWQ